MFSPINESGKTKPIETQAKNEIIKDYNKNNKNINVFFPIKEIGKIEKPKKYKDEDLPFHCRKDISSLPTYFAARANGKYLDKINLIYAIFQKRLSCKKVGLSNKPIAIPVISKKSNKNNGNKLEKTEIFDKIEMENNEPVLALPQRQLSTSDIDIRSSKRTKRKCYKEDSDEENFHEKKPKEPSKLGRLDLLLLL